MLWRAGRFLAVALALGGWLAGSALAQSSSAGQSADPPASNSQSADDNVAPAGLNFGNYHVTQSVEMGWRYSDITGSQDNYDTFVNLQQGPRLLNVSLNVRSLNHDGALFDTLSLNGFGFGGDPDNVVRLRMSKNKWYNFDATYRRDKYFWNYNLMANPLNPIGTAPPVDVNYSLHAMDLSRRMTGLNLTLLPQSRFRVRLGYDHELLVGPSLSTNHVGTEAQLYQDWKNTTDIYHVGFDYTGLKRTTLSYDQFVQHFKQDTSYLDTAMTLFGQNNSFLYTLANGTPVDLGVTGGCAAYLTAGNATCNAYLSYSRDGRPRITMPTERFSFQSTFIPNFTTTGHFSYSHADNTMSDYLERFTGYESRTADRAATVGGSTSAKRNLVDADWSGVYQVTSKFRILDTFNYNNYRLPGQYNFLTADLFAQAPQSGQRGMLLPPAVFNSTNCPPPFTAATCPQHVSSSAADAALGADYRYQGQDLKSNTFQVEYDFTPKVGAEIGYRFINRKIYEFSSTFYTSEAYYPGGSFTSGGQTYSGAAAAARGDCALPAPSPIPSSFAVYNSDGSQRGTCVLQSDGSLVYSGYALDVDTVHNLEADINGHSALFGLWVRPTGNFRSSFNLELFSADQAFTRITPRQLRHYQFNTTYMPAHWAEITGAVDVVQSADNVIEVQDQEHNRSYSISTIFTPKSRFSFDLSYNYNDIYTQALDCWTTTPTQGAGTCPAVLESPVGLGGLSIYQSKSHFASFDMMVQPVKQATVTLGYAGSFVRGDTSFINPDTLQSIPFLNPNTPYGPLRFNYLTPYATLTINMHRGFSYRAAWNYYGYNSRGPADPVTLLPLGTQDFNGNNMTLSVRYSF